MWWKGRNALQAGHASPVKWCLKEKVLLGNSQQLQCWSYNIYGWLGGHWPRGSTGRRPVRKKRPTKRVFFFWFPLLIGDASSQSGLTDFSPHSNIYLSPIHELQAVPFLTSGSTAPGASPGSPGLSAEKLSEAFIRTSQFELWNFTRSNFSNFYVYLIMNFLNFYVYSSNVSHWALWTFKF